MGETRTDTEILRAARERIADQGHFVMGSWGWNHQGREVDPIDPTAWRWSARGAIWAESGVKPLPFKERGRDQRAIRLFDQAAEAVATEHGIRFPAGTDLGDNLGHPLTLQALDAAMLLSVADAYEPADQRHAEARG